VEPCDIAILTAAALATATLTATVGLGGGMILLAVMLLHLEPLVAIPVHGVVQLVSNSTRTYIQRRYVRWPIFWRYALLLVPMGYAGLLFAQSLSPRQLTGGIGFFLLAATWAPLQRSRAGPRSSAGVPRAPDPLAGRTRGGGERRFLLLGAVVGFLSVIVGATGPLVGPFLRNLGLPRQGVVGTFSACQTATHIAKLLVFGTAGFAFGAYLGPMAAMSVAVVAGTWLGSQLLERVNERLFRGLYRAALTLVAIRLVLWEGLRIF
jgi:uncharacterized membrane protein YfcA